MSLVATVDNTDNKNSPAMPDEEGDTTLSSVAPKHIPAGTSGSDYCYHDTCTTYIVPTDTLSSEPVPVPIPRPHGILNYKDPLFNVGHVWQHLH